MSEQRLIVEKCSCFTSKNPICPNVQILEKKEFFAEMCKGQLTCSGRSQQRLWFLDIMFLWKAIGLV